MAAASEPRQHSEASPSETAAAARRQRGRGANVLCRRFGQSVSRGFHQEKNLKFADSPLEEAGYKASVALAKYWLFLRTSAAKKVGGVA